MAITEYNYKTTRGRMAGARISLLAALLLTMAVSRGARNLWTLTITGAAAVTTTCTVGGVSVSVTGSAASAAASASNVYAALLAADLGDYIISYPGSGAAITIQGREYGEAFAVAFSDSGGFTATAVETTQEDAGDSIPPGILCVPDPNDPTHWVVPASPNTVSDVWNVTPATPNASDICVLTVSVEQVDGTWITYHREVAAAGTVKLTVEAIEPVVEAIPGVSSSEDDTKVVLSNDLAVGLRLKVTATVRGTNGTTLAATNPTPADGNPFLGELGVAVLEQNRELPSGGGNAVYAAGDELAVAQSGEWEVLTDAGVSLAVGDAVYVRVVASASEQAGAIRGDTDSGDAILAPRLEVVAPTIVGIDGQRITGIRLRALA